MPKTFNLSFANQNGKTYHGVSADNHVVYKIIGGLPKYSAILLTTGCTVGIATTLSIQKIYHAKKHVKKTDNDTIQQPFK